MVLDLHGAPGGQTGTNIDDAPNRRPELVDQDRYGYQLVDLDKRLTDAIRSVDDRHLIIYEGTHWATNWRIFDEVWDANSMLQFHRYWCPPDRPRIQAYLDVRARLDLPIYMGEGGENNPEWLAVAFQLYEDHEISWNLWPWKKIDTITSPYSVDPPAGWPDIAEAAGLPDAVDSVAGAGLTGPAASGDDAWEVLDALLDAMVLDRCRQRPEVINAVFRRAPITLPAWGFGFHGTGQSYATQSAAPLAGLRPDDHVTIWHTSGTESDSLDFHHTDGRPRDPGDRFEVVLEPGDWVAYEITTVVDGTLKILLDVEVATDEPVPVTVCVNDIQAKVSADGSNEASDDGSRLVVDGLTAGTHRVRVEAGAPIVLSALHFRVRTASPADCEST